MGEAYQKQLKAKKMEKFQKLRILLPPYMNGYLSFMQSAGRLPNTLVAYARDLLTFCNYLLDSNPSIKGTAREIPLDVMKQLTHDDMIEYKNYLLYNGTEGQHPHSNQNSSAERRFSPLRGFFAYAVDEGMLDKNPTMTHLHAKMKQPTREIVRLDHDEISDIIISIRKSEVGSIHQNKYVQHTKYRDQAILTLLLNTGLRVSECVGIDLEDLDLKRMSVSVTRKGGKKQIVYFNEHTRNAIQHYIEKERGNFAEEGQKALFLSMHRNRMSVNALQNMIRKYAEAVLPPSRAGKISPHKLRSTYATALYALTGDLGRTAAVLGHSDLNTTRRYYAAISDDQLRQTGELNVYKRDGKETEETEPVENPEDGNET